jgi:hypothetical protein
VFALPLEVVLHRHEALSRQRKLSLEVDSP